jgi:uncharacterized protein YbjT (DUF2867 family)
MRVLVVGATGSIGQFVVKRAATKGHDVRAQSDLEPLFVQLDADPPGALDAFHDMANMPLLQERQRVREALDADKKILIVYLSRTGNTKALAQIVHQEVGGTMAATELEKSYRTAVCD